ncbi:MAG: hypothetical protein ACLGI5_12770 [Thermoleophilia bacterium]
MQPSISRLLALIALALVAIPSAALADQSSQPSSPAAGQLTAGSAHSCAITLTPLRCWGFGGNGRLGLASSETIGDDETPGSQGPVDFGPGRAAVAVSAGEGHTCALLDDDTVRCWGFGGNGRLGYASTESIGDDESPAATGPIDIGAGRTAAAIAAGASHTCAALDDGSVRCWGYGDAGQLGYGNGQFAEGVPIVEHIGDNETPGSVAPVDLGPGAVATTISAGESHTCALLADGSARCWGFSGSGQLGLGDPGAENIGDDEAPSTVDPIDLGDGRTATAISAGSMHTCAVLDDATIRCWGFGANGQLGYGNVSNVGASQTPGSVGPVDLGPGRTAKAVSAGRQHTCAILDDGSVRCWGAGSFGQLGYGNQASVGDDETPGSVAPVDLGAGRSAIAIAAGDRHTCALLDDISVRCWGDGANGRLGYCSQSRIGDDESPAAAGPVDLAAGGAGCAAAVTPGGTPPPVAPPPPPLALPLPPAGPLPAAVEQSVDRRAAARAAALAAERRRARRLKYCIRAAMRKRKALRGRARKACVKRHSRVPGRVLSLRARAVSRTRVVLTFSAPGSDARRQPAARGYLVRQSRRPIRRTRDFERAPSLCRGSCRFIPSAVGTRISLTVTGLRPRTTYYYAVAARDNASGRRGPRSKTVRVRTR